MSKQGKVIVVTSGKGGVGKTTTSASIAAGLALEGKRVCVIDFDVGLRNLDLILGCERKIVFDFVQALRKECKLHQAIIQVKAISENLHMIPASQTRDKDHLTKEGVEEVMDSLRERFDFIICDSPAGIENGAKMAMYFADEAIIVTNPEVSSVRDSDRILGFLDASTQKAESDEGESIKQHLLLTRYNPERAEKGEMMSHETVVEILGIPLIGVIPESTGVLESSNAGKPVITGETDAADAYADVVARLLGETSEIRFLEPAKKGFLSRLFGG